MTNTAIPKKTPAKAAIASWVGTTLEYYDFAVYGYFMGCRDRRLCPRGGDGLSCAEARAQHRRDLARAAGVAPRAETLDSGAAAARIRDLRSRGWSLRRIAAATGCGRTTIAELADEQGPVRRRVTADTLRRILGVAAG